MKTQYEEVHPCYENIKQDLTNFIKFLEQLAA
jgi:hypothetical protein